jgi:hypothetical protein
MMVKVKLLSEKGAVRSSKKVAMHYLLLICHDASFVPTGTLVKEIHAWIRKMEGRGIRKYGNPLRPPADAATVRVRGGKLQLQRGPFARSREKACAYELLECASMEEAIDAAASHPMAKAATIEVRPIWTELARPERFLPRSSGRQTVWRRSAEASKAGRG